MNVMQDLSTWRVRKAILFALANSDVDHILLIAKSKGQSCNNSFWTLWENCYSSAKLGVEVFLFFLDSLFFFLYCKIS